MPKNTVKPEAAEPIDETATSDPGDQNDLAAYTEKTALGGPIPVVMGSGRMACKMKLSGRILECSGLKANDKVELIAGENEIIIRKTGEPSRLPIKGCSAAKKQMLDVLMAEGRAFEAKQREARERRMAYREEIAAEPEEPLDKEQRRREEL